MQSCKRLEKIRAAKKSTMSCNDKEENSGAIRNQGDVLAIDACFGGMPVAMARQVMIAASARTATTPMVLPCPSAQKVKRTQTPP